MPSESIELVQCSEDTSQFSETKPLHNLLMLGLWPFMFSFARRCHEAGIAVHTIHIANEQLARPRQAPLARVTILRSEIGTDAAMQRFVSFAHAVKADAICTVEESTLQWLVKNRNLLEPRCRLMAPPRQPRPLKRGRRATSKRTLLAQILASLKRPPGPSDFPQASRSRSAWSNFVEALTVPDPLFSWRDPRGTWLYPFRGMDM